MPETNTGGSATRLPSQPPASRAACRATRSVPGLIDQRQRVGARRARRRRCRSGRRRRSLPGLIWQSTGQASQRTLSAAIRSGARECSSTTGWPSERGAKLSGVSLTRPSAQQDRRAGRGRRGRIAARRRLGVTGTSRMRTPVAWHGSRSGSPAPSPSAPARPRPWRPKGPSGSGSSTRCTVIGGTSPTVGIR